MSDFRYFRVDTEGTSRGPDFYRFDPDTHGQKRIRWQNDGLWIDTSYSSVHELFDYAKRYLGQPQEVRVDEVPCPMCLLVDGAVTRILVREWVDAIAITPRPAPVVAGHVVVIPKVHATGTITPSVAGLLAARAAELAADHGDRSWNYIQSNGRPASQTEPHFHAHLVPREANDGLLLPWSPAPTHLEGDSQ